MCHSRHDVPLDSETGYKKKVKRCNHKLYMDSSISSPDIY